LRNRITRGVKGKRRSALIAVIWLAQSVFRTISWTQLLTITGATKRYSRADFQKKVLCQTKTPLSRLQHYQSLHTGPVQHLTVPRPWKVRWNYPENFWGNNFTENTQAHRDRLLICVLEILLLTYYYFLNFFITYRQRLGTVMKDLRAKNA